ncbi:heavy metal-associated domain-containing protein [Prosthecobacter sp.]|uniref:heavy-metal-associated domain-containing protein n=1 Tax=Prosthecobacter sp. TaxID=1965333 RepID=UPI002486DB7E|nr:heavy metal-associated domain-containing protein [Prosthecobacter sp.]MDI1310902.1 heavy metal-associated domain-containing protein [Prosthecobacter sp.]
MKHLFTLLLSLLFISTSSCTAGEPVQFVYQGEVAGIMCIHCTNKVEAAMKKLPDVQSVKITRNEKGGLPKLEIIAANAKITREDAVKALGDDAKMFDIRSLKLVQGK